MDQAHPWLSHYRTPTEVDLTRFGSVNEVFLDSCQRFANQVARASLGVQMSYAELEARSRDFAAWLPSPVGGRWRRA